MNSLTIILVLSLLHASVVAIGVLLVRSCIPHRFVASRAGVGGVGLACVLLVTALAFLPLPTFGQLQTMFSRKWTETTSNFTKHSDAPDAFSSRRVSEPEATIKTTASGSYIPITWLHRIGQSFNTAITTVDTAPRLWLNVLLAILFFGIAVNVLRFSLALYHVHRLYKKSIVITDDATSRLLIDFQTRCKLPAQN